MVDLPEPNLNLLSTTASKSVFTPSDVSLQLVLDSSHNPIVKGEDETMETVGKDYSNRKSLDKFWPTFIPNPKIKNTYTKMMNSAMPKDIFAFMDEDNQVTDILRFSGLSTDPASADVEILASFGSLFTHVTVH